jgi:hypothetical protein
MLCLATAGCPKRGMSSVPSVHSATFAGYAVHARSLESHVFLHRLKEAGDLLGEKPHRLADATE